jgi:23S rRNA (adenine2503-C2)-methyltransferase
MDAPETETWAASHGLEPYRGRQLRHWLFHRLAGSFEEMTELPKSLRAFLKDHARIQVVKTEKILTSEDGTRKFLFRLSDDLLVESVLIPEKDHWTLCISSQVGCAMGCRFCFTGARGLLRNLSPSEIVDQVIQVKKNMDAPDRLTNIVLMGMGEPLANYGAVVKAIWNITGEDGLNMSNRKVTLSTCGIVPRMKDLGQDVTINLAVSLNATEDQTRTFLMPINAKYPLEKLMAACRQFPLPNRRMITFEYILVHGVNDYDADAERLGMLLKNIRAKINLIPLNPYPGLDMASPPMERILSFQQILLKNHLTAIIRKSKGTDIGAACGQLSGSHP